MIHTWRPKRYTIAQLCATVTYTTVVMYVDTTTQTTQWEKPNAAKKKTARGKMSSSKKHGASPSPSGSTPAAAPPRFVSASAEHVRPGGSEKPSVRADVSQGHLPEAAQPSTLPRQEYDSGGSGGLPAGASCGGLLYLLVFTDSGPCRIVQNLSECCRARVLHVDSSTAVQHCVLGEMTVSCLKLLKLFF